MQLTEQPIAVAELTSAVSSPSCGAIVTFIGAVRDNHDGKTVARLEYSSYAPMALREMEKIVRTIRQEWAVERVSMVHRLGSLEIGDVSIAILLALAHREEGFAALQYAIDTFKETVPIWKKEYFTDGQVSWVEGS